MVSEWLQRLLVLQDRDSRCDSIKRQIADIPREVEKEKAAIERQREALEAEEQAFKQMEVQRHDLEGQVEAAEEQILKYKTQQMQVKKNEEYTALENEIHNLQQKISGIEDEELNLLDKIDEARAALEILRTRTAEESAVLEAHVERLHRNLEAFNADLGAAEQAVVDCSVGIEADKLQQYHYVKSQIRRPPVVVPMEDGRCRGCHLKVSGEVETMARRGTELVRCDSCGRILYYDR
jgi:hypothetical protein